MDSGYNCVSSYPHQRGQMHYWPHHHPGAEAIPTAIYTGPDCPPVNYEYMPWCGNYGYNYPVICHACGSHSCFPSNYPWRPPFSYIPPACCRGSSPSPMQYVPPKPYGMQQPWGYEKKTPINHHCCGCLDGGCSRSNVKIVEEQPDGERKKIDSLVPSQLKHGRPIVLLPPGISNDKDGKVCAGDVKPHEDVNTVEEQHPIVWNNWFPYDLRNQGSRSQGGRNEEKNQKQQADGNGSFPFPFIWMPCEPEKNEVKSSKVDSVSQEPSMVESKCSSAEEKPNEQTSSRIREIPVRDLQSYEDKVISNEGASAREGNGGGEESDDKCKTKKQSAPQKSSKLPPVCLRVDPLPKRRNANGNSRSPNPPGDNSKLDLLPKDSRHIPSSSENEKPAQIPGIENKHGEGKNADTGNLVTLLVNSVDDASTKQTEKKPSEESLPCQHSDFNEGSQNDNSESTGPAVPEEGLISVKEVKDELKRSNKREFSDEEAAIIIQSAYRGFDVRKSEPVNKLKQIARVREEIAEVEDLIQKMESDPAIRGCSKQRTIVAETIMSLLLKLDTIQGLHPSVREVRKYVAKQLVNLQEKFDLLINKKTEVSPENESVTSQGEETASQEDTQCVSVKPLNELDGGSQIEEMQIPDKDLMDVPTDNSDLASEQTIKVYEEQIKEVQEDTDSSTSRDLVDGETSELPCLHSSQPSEFSSEDMLGSDPTEFPQGVAGESYTPEGANGKRSEVHAHRENQPQGEVQMEETATSELQNHAIDDVNKEGNESAQELDLHDEEINCPLNVAVREVDEGSDCIFKTEESFVQLPQDSVAYVSEPCGGESSLMEGPGRKDRITELLAGPCAESGDDMPSEKASCEEIPALETSPEQEIICHANDSANIPGAIPDSCSDQGQAPGGWESKKVKYCQEEIGDVNHHSVETGNENDSDLLLRKENLEEQDAEPILVNKEIPADGMVNSIESALKGTEDDYVSHIYAVENDKKPMEDNIRLREMLENLIRSSEQQLTALTKLSERVRDLERKQSTKRRMKLKQCRAQRSRLHQLADASSG